MANLNHKVAIHEAAPEEKRMLHKSGHINFSMQFQLQAHWHVSEKFHVDFVNVHLACFVSRSKIPVNSDAEVHGDLILCEILPQVSLISRSFIPQHLQQPHA